MQFTNRPYLTKAAALALLIFPGAVAGAQFRGPQGQAAWEPPLAHMHYARTRDYHVRHLNLVLSIDPATHSAAGVVTHELAPLRDGLRKIEVDAGANLTISSCTIGGVSKPFTHTGEQLFIDNGSALARGQYVSVAIHYAMPGGGRFGGANGAGGWHWIDADPNQPDRVPGFWSQGETDGNHHWVPLYDYPNDKCASDEIVTVPEAWECIGNGALISDTVDPANHTRTVHWQMKLPHSTYLLSLAGGELDIQKAEWRGVPLYYVVPKGRGWMIPGSFGNTPDMLSFYSDKLGYKYAWPKYAQDAMIDFGGGMENVSATTLGANSLTDLRAGLYPMASLDSHELAHQWFGDNVTCKDWGDIWLNESFATFMQMMYTTHLNGKDAGDFDRDRAERQYLFEASRYIRPVRDLMYSDKNQMFDSHTYPKGGLILNMLRLWMGDGPFWRGMGHYLRTNQFTPVDTKDLEKALTDSSGINVGPFFDQWIFKPGHPVLSFTWNYDQGAGSVSVEVLQQQDTSNGTPIYNMPLTLAAIDGETGAVTRHAFTLDARDQTFTFPAASRPGAVLLDPDHSLLKQMKSSGWTPDELPVILEHAPCVVDRVAAANLLAARVVPPFQRFRRGQPRPQPTQALTDANARLIAGALANEKSPLAASAFLTILGAGAQEWMRPLFRSQAAVMTEPDRRAAALAALGRLPATDADVATERTAALSDTEQYSVVEAGLRTLAGWNDKANLDAFTHQVAVRSPGDQLAATVVSALTADNTDAVLPVLTLASQGSERAVSVRADAIKHLAALPAGDASVTAVLVSLLKPSNPPVLAVDAINALHTRGDKSAAAAIQNLASETRDQAVKDAAQKALADLG